VSQDFVEQVNVLPRNRVSKGLTVAVRVRDSHAARDRRVVCATGRDGVAPDADQMKKPSTVGLLVSQFDGMGKRPSEVLGPDRKYPCEGDGCRGHQWTAGPPDVKE
jgi:hypothetical protein